MSEKFNTYEAVEKLQALLSKYAENEDLGLYDENCYILDVLFFLGMSIDNEEYGMEPGFRKFMARKVSMPAEAIAKAEFKRNLGMKR